MAQKNYKLFIEKYFSVIDKESQQPIPFKLNNVQEKYYNLLSNDYPGFDGVREIVLKARQEGMSSFLLALFTVDFLMIPHSISVCISHRKDSTDILFKKVKFYIESYCQKTGIAQDKLLKTDNKNIIENATNKATFYIGTAGSKVGGRGGFARNILFSECAFYQDTEIITAAEMVEATSQQVPQGKGMIFIESTANGMDNYYQRTWEQAEQNKSIYKPRFFSWKEMYSEEWISEKKKSFTSEAMFRQEYPSDPDEAFISTGTPYFDNQILKAMLGTAQNPVVKGKLSPDGSIDILEDDIEKCQIRVYREPEPNEQFVVFADPADAKDFCAAVACSKKHYDFPIVFNDIMESSQFGYELNYLCRYIFNKTGIWPKLAVERNTGQATIYVLKTLNYPDLFRMVDTTAANSHEGGGIGWVTTGHLSGGELQGTRRKMLDDLATYVKQGASQQRGSIYDKQQVRQLMSFMIVKGRAQAKANKKDDLVMATAGAWQVQLLTPAIDFGDWDPTERAREREKWRFK